METRIDNGAGDETQTFVTYDYDALNRVSQVRDHDPANLPATVNDWATDSNAEVTDFQHNTIGLLTTIARPNGVTTNYSYDPQRYFVDEIEHLDSISTLGRYQYDYDNVGNRTAMDITAQDGTVTEVDYRYDDAYRLLQESYALTGGATTDTNYQYDRAGNRTQMSNSSGTSTYTYNADDELTRIDLPNFIYQAYDYDVRGNLIETSYWRDGVIPVQQGNSTTFAYNARNQMIQVELPTTQRIDYAYDHLGNRVHQEVVGSQDPINYLWDEFSRYGDVVLETGVNFTNNNAYRKMDYVLSSGLLVSQTNYAGNTQYFLSDAQGTTRSITDDLGAVTSEYSYDAFGNLDENIDPISVESSYLYTGQQFDVYTELYSLRARMYDPSNGRFLNRDTWAYNYQNPVELNRYAYSQNNPATYSDPSGYTSFIGYAQRVTSAVFTRQALWSGVTNGLANVAIDILFSLMFSTEYTFQNAAVSFGEGFVGGVVSSHIGFKVAGKVTAKLAQLFSDVAIGVGTDVVLRGENALSSFILNAGSSLLGVGFEEAGRRAAPHIVEHLPWMAKYFRDIDPNNPHGNGGSDGNPHGNGGSDGHSSSISVCGLNSFSADTSVETPDGDIPISEVEIGDTVIAYDEETGVIGEYTVTNTISHEDDQIAYVTINGEEIETTPWHLFYTSDGWVEAGELETGDSIVSLSGIDGSVDSVIVVDATQTMYDLTVETVHTFAVGDGDWVVHNCNSKLVPYDDQGLSAVARNYRRNNTYGLGRNLVVYEYIDNVGNLITSTFTVRDGYNMTGAGDYTWHAEQWGWSQLNILPEQVTAIYTEIKPCTGTTGSCDVFLSTLFGDMEIEYSFDSGNELRNAVINDNSIPRQN